MMTIGNLFADLSGSGILLKSLDILIPALFADLMFISNKIPNTSIFNFFFLFTSLR